RTRDGRLPAEAVAELLTPRTRWVAVTAASNALGTVTDPAAIAAAAAGSGARMFVDAVQAVPHFPVDAAAWSADAVVVSAYKWYGPHLGALWVSEAAAEEAVLPEQPPSAGTALPGRLETGTLGCEQILGTGIAAEMLLRRDRAADAAREERTAAASVSALRRIPSVRLGAPPGPGARRAPVVAFRIDGVPAAKAAAALAEEGIAVTHGTFYAAAAMRAAAPDGPEALRAGVSLYTTERDAARLAGAVGGLAGRPADRKG